MTKYAYRHPNELGFGEHHSDDGVDLSTRPAQPPEVASAMTNALAMIDPTEEQQAKLNAFLGRSMADLDMPHDTEVELVGHDDDRNLEIVEWTDRHGDPRRTSIEPDVFASHFEEVPE